MKNFYAYEKIAAAIPLLLWPESPDRIYRALELLSRIRPEQADFEELNERAYWQVIERFLAPRDGDLEHPDRLSLGALGVRAALSTGEERREFCEALWALHDALESRFSDGEDRERA